MHPNAYLVASIYNIYVVDNPVLLCVRGLLDRKGSEEHLQSSNQSMATEKKKKRQKERNDTKHFALFHACKKVLTSSYTYHKKVEEGHSIERVSYI